MPLISLITAAGKATLLSQILTYSDPLQKARFAYDLSEADYDKLLTQAETAYEAKKIDKPTFVLVHTALNTAVDWHDAGKAPNVSMTVKPAKPAETAKPAKTPKVVTPETAKPLKTTDTYQHHIDAASRHYRLSRETQGALRELHKSTYAAHTAAANSVKRPANYHDDGAGRHGQGREPHPMDKADVRLSDAANKLTEDIKNYKPAETAKPATGSPLAEKARKAIESDQQRTGGKDTQSVEFHYAVKGKPLQFDRITYSMALELLPALAPGITKIEAGNDEDYLTIHVNSQDIFDKVKNAIAANSKAKRSAARAERKSDIAKVRTKALSNTSVAVGDVIMFKFRGREPTREVVTAVNPKTGMIQLHNYPGHNVSSTGVVKVVKKGGGTAGLGLPGAGKDTNLDGDDWKSIKGKLGTLLAAVYEASKAQTLGIQAPGYNPATFKKLNAPLKSAAAAAAEAGIPHNLVTQATFAGRRDVGGK